MSQKNQLCGYTMLAKVTQFGNPGGFLKGKEGNWELDLICRFKIFKQTNANDRIFVYINLRFWFGLLIGRFREQVNYGSDTISSCEERDARWRISTWGKTLCWDTVSPIVQILVFFYIFESVFSVVITCTRPTRFWKKEDRPGPWPRSSTEKRRGITSWSAGEEFLLPIVMIVLFYIHK